MDQGYLSSRELLSERSTYGLEAIDPRKSVTYAISSLFSKLGIVITNKEIYKVENLVIGFETRGTHPLALNSQLLGVHPIAFSTKDRAALFEVFNITEHEISKLIASIPNTINPSFIVISDAFNMFCMWLIHLSYILIKDKRIREEFQMNVAKYLHYRFFTSLVNRYFPHGATEKIMIATMNGLTKKYDIIVYGTWRATIEARCKDFISDTGLQREGLERGDDYYLKYAITDIQTRIRDKLKNIVAEYYAARARGDAVSSRSSVGQDMEGEKIFITTVSTLDSMISNIVTEVQSAPTFIDKQVVLAIAKQFPTISASMLNSVLLELSETASVQAQTKKLDEVKKVNGEEVYVGVRILLTNVIQASYRYCINNGIDMSNKRSLYIKIKNIYSASRIADPNINKAKQSIAYFIDVTNKTPRESTKASLRLAVIMYVIYKSFAYL